MIIPFRITLFLLLLAITNVALGDLDEGQIDDSVVQQSAEKTAPKEKTNFFDFLNKLLGTNPKTSSDSPTQLTNNPASSPSDNEAENHGWFFGLKGNKSPESMGAPDLPTPADNEDDDDDNGKSIPVQNKTDHLDNWLNRVLDRLDSLFDLSKTTSKSTSSPVESLSLAAKVPEIKENVEDGFKDIEFVEVSTSSPTNNDDESSKIEQQPMKQEFGNSWGEVFKTVTEKAVPPEKVDVSETSSTQSVFNVLSDLNGQKPIFVITYNEDDNNQAHPDQAALKNDGSKQSTDSSPNSPSVIFDDDNISDNKSNQKQEFDAKASENVSQGPPAQGTPFIDHGPLPIDISKPSQQDSDRSSSDLGSEEIVEPVFCRAKCIELCMTTNGNGFSECKTVCVASTLRDLCANDDLPCLKACGPLPVNAELNSPNITEIKYYSKDQITDSETIEITWQPVPDAVLYIVSIIPDSRSVQNGALIVHEDFTNVPWYSFKKGDICFTYYVRISAVFHDGITPFSPSMFMDRAWATGFPPITVEQSEISIRKLMINELSSVEFAEVNLPLFSPLIFDFTKIQMSSYLLSTGCLNPSATSILTRGPISTPVSDGKMLIKNVQFLYLPHKIVVRLPVEYITLNCNYEFRIALVRTRCGEVIPLVSKLGSFDSKIGADFKLGCDNVVYPGCGRLMDSQENNAVPSSPETVDTPASVADQAPGNAPRNARCNMTGFSVDVIGNPIDRFNITLTWDAVQDGRPKTYIVRHGRVARRFIRDSASDAGVYDDEVTAEDPDLVIPDYGTSALLQKSVKLNRPLGTTELHLVRVCMIHEGYTLQNSDWETARRYAIDMAAFPQPVLAIDPPAEFTPDVVPAVDESQISSNGQWGKVEIPSGMNDNRVVVKPAYLEDNVVVSSPSIVNEPWFRRVYFTQRFNQTYWFYSSFAAVFLFLLSLTLCLWVFRGCSKKSKKHAMKKNQRHAPMIFVGRADSMKQPILPLMVDNDEKKQPQIPPV